MSLEQIKESYSKMLKAFEDAGVSLTESQKADADAFVAAVEKGFREQRTLAERALEKEYRGVFESIMAATRENSELASKIQDRIARVEESRKIAGHVDGFLDQYVESVLPKKTIVDYDRMARLERVHESLKAALVAGEDDVQDKIRELEESYKAKVSKCETEVAKARVALNESAAEAKRLAALLEEGKNAEEETKAEEAKESETAEEETKEEVKEEKTEVKDVEEGEANVEDDIQKILEIEDVDVEEDDMLDGRPHNAHKAVDEGGEVEEDDLLRGRAHNAHVAVDEGETDEDEEFETMEVVTETPDGDVELDESDVIDSGLMQMWCSQSVEVD